MSGPTRDERRLASQIGGYASWAVTPDRTARTANGRAKFESRFADEVDPERKLPAAERERRAESARKAYFTRLAWLSVRARREATA